LGTWFLGFDETWWWWEEASIFEDLASDATQGAILLLWVMLAAIMIVGVLWTRFKKK